MKRQMTKKTIISLATIFVFSMVLVGMIFGLNWLLADQFKQNELDAERKIPRMVLPEGDYFDAYEGTLVGYVSACYIASNGEGIAVVVDQETSRGAIQIMVGVNSEGKITAVVVQNQEYIEVSDAGISDPDYLSVYVGRTMLSAENIMDDYEIDPVPGAEQASDAVYQAVRLAFLQQSVIEMEAEATTEKENGEGGN